MAQDFLAPAARVKELETAGESAMKASLAKGMPHGYEVGYRYFTINGRMLGHGEPIRVKEGERVFLHVLNGSATEIRSLALPGHTFKVVALDGNPLPTPAEVPVLWLGTAERISAVVEMNHPGVWIMGDLADDAGHRRHIMIQPTRLPIDLARNSKPSSQRNRLVARSSEPFAVTRESHILSLCTTAELSQRSPPSSIEQSPAACSLFGSSDSSNKTHSTRTLQRFSPIHF
jgi:Multicopper oxidase